MKKRYLLTGSIVAATIFFIFNLSTQDATVSNGLSKKMTHILVTLTEKLPLHIDPTILSNSLVRDLAHITLFFLLGLLCMSCFFLLKLPYLKAASLTLFIGLVTAFCDEVIQIGSVGRAFEWVDIGKDVGGIAGSIALMGVVYGVRMVFWGRIANK